MSVEYGIQLVDWSEFRSFWKKHRDPDFFHEAEEQGAEWIIEMGPHPHLNYSWKAAIDFSDTFKDLRMFLSKAQRERFEAFFLAFCLTDGKNSFVPPRDLGEEIDETIFFSTIAPETARRLLKLWEKLDMEELRPAFAQITPDPRGYMKTFDHFKRYPEMWADLLRDAVGKKAGIVITLG